MSVLEQYHSYFKKVWDLKIDLIKLEHTLVNNAVALSSYNCSNYIKHLTITHFEIISEYTTLVNEYFDAYKKSIEVSREMLSLLNEVFAFTSSHHDYLMQCEKFDYPRFIEMCKYQRDSASDFLLTISLPASNHRNFFKLEQEEEGKIFNLEDFLKDIEDSENNPLL
ncbi:hypothetical protein [Methanolobus chelungpuianus]|uniref:Uncharacterized protein n=1 Tax=Methanolobus chelungpuianus TaxID=502115 RepID=A0AAE3HBZ6_9EURY|nr:hypothetical protein [Methanolobus chelungpuianus]MCQ6962983.1 hypothetical protein [Methanolobus chelungpuianus]